MKIFNKVVIDLKSRRVVEENSFEWNGVVALARGGGGNAGKVEIDSDIKAYFKDLMDTTGDDTLSLSLYDVMNTALGTGGNPFEDIEAHDPTSDISDMSTQYDVIKEEINGYTVDTVWASFIDAASAKTDAFSTIDFLSSLSSILDSIIADVNTVVEGSHVNDAVTAYENAKNGRFMRSIGRFAAGMAMSNAVMSSAYVMGLAWREFEYEQDVDNYEKQLKGKIFSEIIGREIASYLSAQIQRTQNKDTIVLSGSQLMLQADQAKHELQGELARLRAEIKRLSIAAQGDYLDDQMKLNESYSKWDFDVFMFGANLLGAAQGAAAYVPRAPSKAQSAISGGIAGLQYGAQIGGMIGGPAGAGIGGAIGTILGVGQALL